MSWSDRRSSPTGISERMPAPALTLRVSFCQGPVPYRPLLVAEYGNVTVILLYYVESCPSFNLMWFQDSKENWLFTKKFWCEISDFSENILF